MIDFNLALGLLLATQAASSASPSPSTPAPASPTAVPLAPLPYEIDAKIIVYLLDDAAASSFPSNSVVDESALSSRLAALASERRLTRLTAPTLKTMNGMDATFMIGGTVPTPKGYRNYGLSVMVNQTLAPGGAVDEKVVASDSFILTPYPSLSFGTRSVEMETNVGRGQVALLTGLADDLSADEMARIVPSAKTAVESTRARRITLLITIDPENPAALQGPAPQ